MKFYPLKCENHINNILYFTSLFIENTLLPHWKDKMINALMVVVLVGGWRWMWWMLVQTHTATNSVLREKNREVLFFIVDIPLYCRYKLHKR